MTDVREKFCFNKEKNGWDKAAADKDVLFFLIYF